MVPNADAKASPEPVKTRLVLTPALRVAEQGTSGDRDSESSAANTNSPEPQEPFPLGPEFSQQIADLEPAPQIEASQEPEASDPDSPTDADSDDAPGDPVIHAEAPWTNPEVTLHEAATALSGEDDEEDEEEVSLDPVDVKADETGQNPTDVAAPEAEPSENSDDDYMARETLMFRHTDRYDVLKLSEPIVDTATDTPTDAGVDQDEEDQTSIAADAPSDDGDIAQTHTEYDDAVEHADDDTPEMTAAADETEEPEHSTPPRSEPLALHFGPVPGVKPITPPLDDSALRATQAATLSAKIEALEAAIAQTPGPWEPDDTGADDYAGTDVETIEWQDADSSEPQTSPETAEPEAEDTTDALTLDDSLMDEETLRELVADIVRQELQGALGERITRNVRKLVRREIHRALSTQELD
ncbi:hypothetical protein ACXYMO_11115 [Arenibacterium sp. CAU 1754]